MKRAAIYLRVSSDEQTYENQRPDVERVAQTRGYRIVATYEEQASDPEGPREHDRNPVDADDIARISPLLYEHVIPSGTYHFDRFDGQRAAE